MSEVDRELSNSHYRQKDLLLLRFPDFSQQDRDISAEELENKTQAVALFLNRVDTEASARDSILTTCQALRKDKKTALLSHEFPCDASTEGAFCC